MGFCSLLVLLLSCRIQAVGAQVKLSPQALTVLQGEEARFTCSTSNTRWTVMVWLLNDKAVLTISKENGVLPTITPNVTAEMSPDSQRDSWVFVLKNTERNDQGQVTCDLQGIERKTARLFVQGLRFNLTRWFDPWPWQTTCRRILGQDTEPPQKNCPRCCTIEKGSVKVFGDDKMAFRGQWVQFECQAAGWYPQPTLQWQVYDRKVSQGEYSITSEESGKSLFTVTSSLNVTATKSSHVDCLASVSALPTPLKSSVRLTVVAEVVQERDDCTVPLAVTASLSAVLLLILLCICTVLWYRQRKQPKPSPQEAIRFDQSVSGRDLVAGATGGMINLGYSSEGPTGP